MTCHRDVVRQPCLSAIHPIRLHPTIIYSSDARSQRTEKLASSFLASPEKMIKHKRKSSGGDNDTTPTKRPRQMTQSINHGRVDPNFGQRSALPGLDEHDLVLDDEDLDYGDDGGALSYLRSVR
jgi:hypothetical protein